MVDQTIDLLPEGLEGMEILKQLDQIIVKSQSLWITDYCSNNTNTYKIFNSTGQDLFDAEEQSTQCDRWFAGAINIREFSMNITDKSLTNIIKLVRPGCRCALPYGQACFISSISCCMLPCWCCNLCADSCIQEIEVYSGTGDEPRLGSVKQKITNWDPEFIIKDAMDTDVLTLRSRTCIYGFRTCKDTPYFDALTFKGEQNIGKIYKEETNAFAKWGSQAGNFGVTFPIDLHVNMKATLLGAAFLIDCLYFEYAEG